MKRFKTVWRWTLSWWTSPMDDTAPVFADELTQIRDRQRDLEKELRILSDREREVEAGLMNERSELVLKRLLAFQAEFKDGDLKWRYREFEQAIELLKRTGRDWIQFFAKYMETEGTVDRSIRSFYLTFTEQAAKPASDFGDSLEYIGKRKKSNNPFTIGGAF